MDENRLRSHLNLIQSLLTCPSGAEMELLQEHSELIDSDLIEVMQQVASRMAADGEQNAADFLQQLAEQISQALAAGVQGENAEGNSAYLQLIQQLLSCPSGEEAQILQDNLELLDAGFLQACEAVAATLAQQGNENNANFLRNLATQVGEFLGMREEEDSDNSEGENPEEYSNFILELLQAEQDSNSDVAVVYPILKQRQHLLNARFAETLQQVASNLIAEHPEGTRKILGDIENLSIDISNFPLGRRANNIEIAIAGYQIVLNNREPGSEKWVRTQNNLAIAYRNRIRGEKAQNIEVAIASYTNALSVLTRDAFPEQWALTQNNLAAAYSDRIRGEKAENIELAIASYTNALSVSTRDAFPEQWALTQNNLAAAYSDRIRGEKAENIELAIASYTNALSVRTRDAFPENWAATQNNLATAYRERIRGEKAENLELAIASYTNALSVYTPDTFPEDWAMTQNNLAAAYSNRIRGEKAENIEVAIQCFRQALEVRTPSAFPLDCLQTGCNLGNIAFELQDWENATYGYENAITAVEQSRAWAASQRSKRQILENALPIYEKLVLASIHLERYHTALLTVERSKSRTLIELLDDATLEPKNSTPQQKQSLRQLRNQIASLQQQLDSNEPTDTTDTDSNTEENRSISNKLERPQTATSPLETELKNRQQQLTQLLTEINDPDFTLTQQVIPQLPDFTQFLDSETALIEWYLPPNPESGFHAFIVTLADEEPPKSPLPSETKNLVPPLTKGGLGGVQTQIQQEEPPKSPLVRGTLNNQEEPPKSPLPSETPNLVPPLTKGGLGGVKTQIQHLAFTPENRQQLDTDIATYLSDYRQKTWSQALSHRLPILAQSLHLNQVLEKLPPTIQKLILIPHRDLHLLPLHALPATRKLANNQTQTDYLLELYPNGVQYAPSSQFLDRLHQRQRPPTTKIFPLFAIQNPTEDLRYTEIEVAEISRPFNPHAHILKNREATKIAFNSEATLTKLTASYYAHFSCHGSFNSNNPMNSALLLAGDAAQTPLVTAELPSQNPEETDKNCYLTLRNGNRFRLETQCLTLKEIFATLNLPYCRLVTLSACETGLVSSVSTDEYIGLASGFLYAGATNVVSSLWSVSDFSTAFLMIRFYENLKHENLSVSQALQAAQNWLRTVNRDDFLTWLKNDVKIAEDSLDNLEILLRRNFANPPFADPQYWAAFCAIGI
ncbi:CHAT domain-containing tetratricopeptide repeat protein [Microcoleus sp. Aus8_D4]|uniref:CHAT domain-containing tetratricopeptide repeat protein n=1 Tax=Microcoleus sp. Aus8_D4 TaxID=2818634 RepID=UPI002FD64ABE